MHNTTNRNAERIQSIESHERALFEHEAIHERCSIRDSTAASIYDEFDIDAKAMFWVNQLVRHRKDGKEDLVWLLTHSLG